MPRAFLGAGLTIRFYKKDTLYLKEGGDITLDIISHPGKTVEMHIVDEFDEATRKIKQFLSEPWIRTDAVFDSEPPHDLKIYRIWLEKKASLRMLTEREPPMGDGGIETRGFDRICMTYWNI